MRAHRVRALLMGGQACVFYGAAEFSRDTDFAILADRANLSRLRRALAELRAEPIAVPPFELKYLRRGHALHFRCHHPDAMRLRVDLMSKMRGVDGFNHLWNRRTTLQLAAAAGIGETAPQPPSPAMIRRESHSKLSPHQAGTPVLAAVRTMNNNQRNKMELSLKEREQLLKTLKARFEKNLNRHRGLDWAQVQARLEANPEKLWSLHEMELTGGEPDVVGQDNKTGEYVFYDCSAQSPKGRASLCYDREAQDSRKTFKPKNNAMDMAAAMGVELLTEEQYLELQKLGEFDTKSSSWVKSPAAMRKLGGALFGDRRFGRVFLYHNGAESYYSGRGFRGSLKV